MADLPDALKDVPRCDGKKAVQVEFHVNVVTHDGDVLFTDEMLSAAFQQVVTKGLQSGALPSTIGYGEDKSRMLRLVSEQARPAIFVAVKSFRVRVGTLLEP